MEVCAIFEGKKYSKKLNEKQVTAMLRAACQRPREREDNITQVMVNGGRVDHWACLNFSRKVGKVAANRFVEQLIRMCSNKGVAYPVPLLPMRFRQPGKIERALVDLHKEANSKLEKEPLCMLFVNCLYCCDRVGRRRRTVVDRFFRGGKKSSS
ncbi:hypothetical protein MKX03_028198 [Papaver bracteatum]|nr:hypothetical protein MKX03_028198 [Papaver bracteatum]